jgi:hypothetical protein
MLNVATALGIFDILTVLNVGFTPVFRWLVVIVIMLPDLLLHFILMLVVTDEIKCGKV